MLLDPKSSVWVKWLAQLTTLWTSKLLSRHVKQGLIHEDTFISGPSTPLVGFQPTTLQRIYRVCRRAHVDRAMGGKLPASQPVMAESGKQIREARLTSTMWKER